MLSSRIVTNRGYFRVNVVPRPSVILFQRHIALALSPGLAVPCYCRSKDGYTCCVFGGGANTQNLFSFLFNLYYSGKRCVTIHILSLSHGIIGHKCMCTYKVFLAERKLSKSNSQFVQQNVSQVANLYRDHFFKTIVFIYKSLVITCTVLWTSKLYFKSSIKASSLSLRLFRLHLLTKEFAWKRTVLNVSAWQLSHSPQKKKSKPSSLLFFLRVRKKIEEKKSVGFIDN